jgi:hypothetical protein
MLRALVACCVLACAGQGIAQQAPPQTPLRKIATDQGCSTSGLPSAAAGALVVSFAVLHDGADCTIAFVRDLQRLGTPLEVISARGKSWAYAKVAVSDADRGAVSAIAFEGGTILVTLDAPDDGVIEILTSDLKRIGTIHGSFVRTWPNGLIQYDAHHAGVAPHQVHIGIFDPGDGQGREIYEAASGILAPLYFDWQTNTFAFALEDQRMVTCDGLSRLATIKCRDTPLDAWQKARPDLDLTQLVRFAAAQPRFR